MVWASRALRAASGSSSKPKKLSATALGTAFELHSQHVLQSQLSMDLKHSGGRGDKGIDLIGWWRLPQLRERPSVDGLPGSYEFEQVGQRRIRVLVQCKAECNKLRPETLRALEGTYSQTTGTRRASWDDLEGAGGEGDEIPSAVAIMCSAAGFSEMTVRDMKASSTPMLLLHLPKALMDPGLVDKGSSSEATDSGEDSSGTASKAVIRGALWNSALIGGKGALGSDMELRLMFASEETGSGVSEFGLGLYCAGKRLQSFKL